MSALRSRAVSGSEQMPALWHRHRLRGEREQKDIHPVFYRLDCLLRDSGLVVAEGLSRVQRGNLADPGRIA